LYVLGNENDQNYYFKQVYVYIIIKLFVLSGPTWLIYWTSMPMVIWVQTGIEYNHYYNYGNGNHHNHENNNNYNNNKYDNN